MVMLGEPTPIAQVPQVADFIVPDDKLDHTARELATRLSKGPTRAYAAAKSLLKAWSVGGIPAADKLMLDLSIDTYNTDDAQLAVSAGAAVYEALLRGDAPPTGDADFHTEYTGR
jgi:enoyl-CoA hydratase/carnithine racemase